MTRIGTWYMAWAEEVGHYVTNGDANWRKKLRNLIKPARFCHVSRFCAAYSQVKSLLSTKANDLACRSLEKRFFFTPDESSTLDQSCS